MRHWYRYLDWLLPLAEEYDDRVWQELNRALEEKRMPFVTYAERVGFRKGEEKGLQKGLLQGIESLLEVKFGDEGVGLFPEVGQQTDPNVLEKLLQFIKTATNLDDVRRFLLEASASGKASGPDAAVES